MAQSLKVGTYDPREVSVSVAGTTLTGFAEGEFVNIESNANIYDDTSGSDGEVGRWRTVDNRGTMTVTLLKTSESNAFLSLLMNADAKTGKGSFPVIIKDSSANADITSGSVAWIMKAPTKTYSNDGLPSLEWQFRIAHVEYTYSGHADISP